MPHTTIYPAWSNLYPLLNLFQSSLFPMSSSLLCSSFPLVPTHLLSLFQPGCPLNIHICCSLLVLELQPGECWEDKTGQVLGLPSCPLENTIICPRGSPTQMLQFQPGPHLMCAEPSEMFVLIMEMGFLRGSNFVFLKDSNSHSFLISLSRLHR